MASPRRLDPKSVAEGRRLEREEIAKNLYWLGQRQLAITPNDGRVIAMIAQSVWAGTLSKRRPADVGPSPWTPDLSNAS